MMLSKASKNFTVVNNWLLSILDVLNTQYDDIVQIEEKQVNLSKNWTRWPVYEYGWVYGCAYTDPLLTEEAVTEMLKTTVDLDTKIVCCTWSSFDQFAFRKYEMYGRNDPDNTFLVEVDIMDPDIALLVKLASS